MSQINEDKLAKEMGGGVLNDEAVLDDRLYFPIRELSLKTGVNSVTLRAWERRYGLLKPKRTGKGHRLYDLDDVSRVESILRWVQQGVAVSKVRALLDQNVALDDTVSPSNEWLEWQEALVSASKGFQEDKIEQLYQQIFSQYPAEIATRDWLLPSFEALGKGAALSFCESVLLTCLMARVSSLKSQQKTPKSLKGKATTNVLIMGLSSQRVLWCYMAAAILLDKGVTSCVVANATQENDWLSLIEGMKVESALIFTENELAPKASHLVMQMNEHSKPIALIGAGVWLAANDAKLTSLNEVKVYSGAFEGVMGFVNQI